VCRICPVPDLESPARDVDVGAAPACAPTANLYQLLLLGPGGRQLLLLPHRWLWPSHLGVMLDVFRGDIDHLRE
jgi:hypothetical protein